ncbi:MAG: HAMP domain-containing histidine kinase [Gemmatimonadales bacterium]|nr:MAG: HAMP domain-containing histidine kinase [Gemmatimonadales bacterium]
MVRPRSFRRNVFKTVLLVALAPAALALVTATLLLREMGTGTGTLGPWDSVAESGRALVEAARVAAPDDPDVARLAEIHQAALSESVRQSRLYSFVTQRAVQVLPWVAFVAALFLVALSSLAARRVSKRLGGPVGELVEWTQLVAAGEALPPREEVRRPIKEFRVLREALRTMATELAEARDREVEAAQVRAWSDVARRVAHELKNPLTPIRMGAASLVRHSEPRVRETGEMILQEVGRLDQMARDFSRFGRPPTGPAAPVDVDEMLRSLANRHAPTEGGEVRVKVQVEEGLPLIPGHYDSLSRAVLNLLVNAQEALEGQSGAQVTLGARALPGGVEIFVRDNGPGVPPELQATIWSPEVTTRRRGSGLGLAMVRQTAQAHGGEATVTSPDQGGAEFRLFLPVDQGIADRLAGAFREA